MIINKYVGAYRLEFSTASLLHMQHCVVISCIVSKQQVETQKVMTRRCLREHYTGYKHMEMLANLHIKKK